MKVLLRALIVFFFLLTAAPLVQMRYVLIAQKGLGGAEVKTKRGTFSWEQFFSGEYQEKFEKWFNTSFGFRGHLVRTDNQINYSVFRELSASQNTRLVLGRDDVLFEHAYIQSLNKRDFAEQGFLEEKVLRIKRIQDFIEARGKVFFILISPSKAALYPELIPEKYIDKARAHLVSNYDRFIPLLDKHRVNYIDGQGFFAKRKETSKHQFFAATGAHWNDVAACLISQEIVRLIEKKSSKKLINFTCAPIKVVEKPRHTDRDLLQLCNLWNESAFYRPTPYPATKAIKTGEEFRPQMLVVGDSFLWAILRFLDYHKVYHRRDMFYYYQRNNQFPSGRFIQIDKQNLDWEADVFSKDVIMVEANAATVHSFGSGFLEDAEAVIKRLN